MKLSSSGEMRMPSYIAAIFLNEFLALMRIMPCMVSRPSLMLQDGHMYIRNVAPANLKLAQKFYGARLVELRDLIAAEEAKFK